MVRGGCERGQSVGGVGCEAIDVEDAVRVHLYRTCTAARVCLRSVFSTERRDLLARGHSPLSTESLAFVLSALALPRVSRERGKQMGPLEVDVRSCDTLSAERNLTVASRSGTALACTQLVCCVGCFDTRSTALRINLNQARPRGAGRIDRTPLDLVAVVDFLLIFCGGGARGVRRVPVHAYVVDVHVGDDAVALVIDHSSIHAGRLDRPCHHSGRSCSCSLR